MPIAMLSQVGTKIVEADALKNSIRCASRFSGRVRTSSDLNFGG